MLAECECSREGKRRRAPSPSSILRLRRRRILQHVMKTGDWGDGTSPSTTGFMFVAAILLFVKTQNECRSELTTYGCLGGTPNTW